MKTKNSFLLALGLFSLTATTLQAQVGINNTAANPDPSAILDLKSGNGGVNKGFLPQSVALTNVTVAAPVVAPATGLIVYSSAAPTGGNGTGYYYWNGSMWASLNNTINGAGTNNYVARWTPNGTTLGTGLIQDNGANVSVNIAPQSFSEFYSYATSGSGIIGWTTDGSSDGAVAGYNSGASGLGVYGAGESYSVEGDASYYGLGSGGYFTDGTNYSVVGDNANGSGITSYGATYGSYASDAAGDYAYTGWAGYGMYAYSSATYGASYFGSAQGAQCWIGDGVINAGGNFVDNSGTEEGVIADGANNSGVYGTSTNSAGFGVYGYNLNATPGSGLGVYGEGSGAAGTYAIYGSYPGVFGEGVACGVGGYCDNTSGDTYPGDFVSGNGDYAIVAAQIGGTDYKVYGSGTVSTVVKDKNNVPRVMACPEAPEILFEDYGTASLSNGKVHVDLDPTYAKNVTINEKHALRVMVTLNDQCNGVYVTNRTATGFDVVELNGGTSNASFTYEVIANRADAYDDNGNLVSKNADNRFVQGINNVSHGVASVNKQTNTQAPLQKAPKQTQIVKPVVPASPAKTSGGNVAGSK